MLENLLTKKYADWGELHRERNRRLALIIAKHGRFDIHNPDVIKVERWYTAQLWHSFGYKVGGKVKSEMKWYAIVAFCLVILAVLLLLCRGPQII